MLKHQLRTTENQNIKTTLVEEIESKISEHQKGKEIKAGIFTNLYINAEGLYKREELGRGI